MCSRDDGDLHCPATVCAPGRRRRGSAGACIRRASIGRGLHGVLAVLTCAWLLTACGGTTATTQGVQRRASLDTTICGRWHSCGESLARSYGPAAIANEHAARAAAEHVLERLPLPAGAREVGPGALASSPLSGAGMPDTPELIDLYRLWRVPGRPQAVLAWIRAHAPRTARLTLSGEAGQYRTATGWNLTFAFPTKPAIVTSEELTIEVARASGGTTALRADGGTVWTIPRPRGERIPAGVRVINVTATDAARHIHFTGTITAPPAIHRVLAVIEGLQRPGGGVRSCPAFEGATVELDFRRSTSAPVLARVLATEGACGRLALWIHGRQQPELQSGRLVGVVRTVLGVG